MMLPHEKPGFRNLLQVVNLSPTFIADALPLDLLLDINQQIELRFRMDLRTDTPGGTFCLAADDVPDLRFGISLSQRIQPYKSFLISASY